MILQAYLKRTGVESKWDLSRKGIGVTGKDVGAGKRLGLVVIHLLVLK